MMKVALVSTFPPTMCGIAEYTQFLAQALKERGSDVVILADKTGKPATAYKNKGLLVVPAFNKESENYPQELLEKVDEFSPQIIHIEHEYGIYHRNECLPNFLKEVRSKNLPIIITMHTVFHSALENKNLLKLQEEMAELADVVIVHTIFQESELIYQDANQSKIWRIPHGTLPVEPMPREKAIKVLNLDIGPKSPVVASLGLIREDKGLEELIAAAKELLKEGRDYYFLVAGTPQHESNLGYYQKITELSEQLGNRVIFITKFLRHEEIRAVLSLAEVIVMSYPTKIYEPHYSCSGVLHLVIGANKPIVYTKTPRLVEIFHIMPELAYNYGNSKELAQKIDLALQDKKLRERVKKELSKLAEETTWIKTASKHQELYRAIFQTSQ
jgi:glycosyltransferase involved in cell wall biosynthesis